MKSSSGVQRGGHAADIVESAKEYQSNPMSRYSALSLGSAVYAELRKRIVDGELRSGDRLREVELASSLGVSRTPVREALKRLENDGLIAYVSSRGVIVAELTAEQAVELYALREVLEGAAARFAAQHALEPETRLLQDMLNRQREIGDDPDQQSKLNRSFHQTIYRMAHNRYLLGVLTKAQDYMVLLHQTAYLAPGRSDTAYAEHMEIVNAIARRDPDAAEAAARRHIREAQRIRMMLQFGM